jgi:hypothetical protein
MSRGKYLSFFEGDRRVMWALSQFSPLDACAFLRTSSLASACRPEPYRQLHQAPLALSLMVALSLDQRLICQTLASDAVHETIEPSERVVFNIAFVQSEGKFINVAAQMLLARMVIDAVQAAFENCENAFNSVGGHVVPNIFASAMVDSIMAEARLANARICASFVCMQGRSYFDVLMNSGLNCFLVPF